MSDPYQGVFDHLSPTDFTVPDTATHQLDEVPEDLDTFVMDNVRAAMQNYSNDGDDSIAVLVTPWTTRFYAPNDTENLGEYAQRLAEQARVLKATRFFVSRTTAVAMLPTSNPATLLGQASTEQMMHLMENGEAEFQTAIWFYAASTAEGKFESRIGLVPITQDGEELGEPIVSLASQRVPLFDIVLGADHE